MRGELFPAVDEQLLKALAERFPDRLPEKPEGADLPRLVGQQDVIRFLRAIHETQTKRARS